MSPLTQGLNYRSACDRPTPKNPSQNQTSCLYVEFCRSYASLSIGKQWRPSAIQFKISKVIDLDAIRLHPCRGMWHPLPPFYIFQPIRSVCKQCCLYSHAKLAVSILALHGRNRHHYAYPRRNHQTDLSWVDLLNTKKIHLRTVTHLSVNPTGR